MNVPEAVVITGIGALSALGSGRKALYDGVIAGQSGVVTWSSRSNSSGEWLAAKVPDAGQSHSMSGLPASLDRHVGLAKLAAQEALADAGLTARTQEESERFGVYWGTGAGSAATLEESYHRLHAGQRTRPLTVLLGMQNAALAQLALDFGLRGPQLSVSQACASAAIAIGEAMLALRSRRADWILVGGSDAPIVPGQMQAWDALRVLARPDDRSPERSCRPFDSKRTGLVIGEGAAAFVLERASVATQRGARIYAQLCGYGNAGDASHYARPDPDGQRRAMVSALRDGQLAPSDIGYINAHATGTTIGDLTEAQAIQAVFDGCKKRPAVSSTKGAHGHTLGAAGALELAVTALALEQGKYPATTNLDETDIKGIDVIYAEPRIRQIDAALSNSFAFGGSNVSLAIKRFSSPALAR